MKRSMSTNTFTRQPALPTRRSIVTIPTATAIATAAAAAATAAAAAAAAAATSTTDSAAALPYTAPCLILSATKDGKLLLQDFRMTYFPHGPYVCMFAT